MLYKTTALDSGCLGLPRLIGVGVPSPRTEDFLRNWLSNREKHPEDLESTAGLGVTLSDS